MTAGECLCWVGHGDCGGCSGYPGIAHEPACGWEQNPDCPEHGFEVRAAEVDQAIEHRLAGGEHFHHRGCVHNLPPEEQVSMRGYTVEKWLAIIGPLPEQITPNEWRRPHDFGGNST